MGQIGSPKFMEDREVGVFYEHQRRSIALTSVVSKWYASCIVLRLEKRERTRELE